MTTLSRRQILVCAAAAALGVGAYAALRRRPATAGSARDMTAPEALAAAASGEILLVDIRRPDEWAETGIPHHAVPLDMREPDFLARLRAARRSPAQPVAVICARGVRSAWLAKQLDAAGIRPVIDVPEGMLGSFSGPGWLKRGLPVT